MALPAPRPTTIPPCPAEIVSSTSSIFSLRRLDLFAELRRARRSSGPVANRRAAAKASASAAGSERPEEAPTTTPPTTPPRPPGMDARSRGRRGRRVGRGFRERLRRSRHDLNLVQMEGVHAPSRSCTSRLLGKYSSSAAEADPAVMSELDASLPRRSGESGGGGVASARVRARVRGARAHLRGFTEMVNACASNAAGDARTRTVSSR